jgi:hypothetical protein
VARRCPLRAGGLLRLRHPAPDGLPDAELTASSWEPELGEFVLDWDETGRSGDPSGIALRFAQEVFQHACLVCEWDPRLAASASGDPPPIA